jgi:hypothetical protein
MPDKDVMNLIAIFFVFLYQALTYSSTDAILSKNKTMPHEQMKKLRCY